MRSGRRVVIILLTLMLLATFAVVWVRWSGGRRGGLDNWIGQQIVGVANSHLVPQLVCSDIDYVAPKGVELVGVRFIAPDGTDVFDVERLSIALAEIPKRGKPIKIERVEIIGGRVNLVRKPEGGFRGLKPLTKVTPKTPEEERPEIEETYRLSNVLELRELVITNGAVLFDPGDGSPATELTDLSLALDIEPSGEAGAYALNFESGRAPGLRVDADGAINIDTFVLDLASATLALDLGPDTVASLPGTLQELLAKHEVTGALDCSLKGTLALLDPEASDLTINAELTEADAAFGDYTFPIERLTLDATSTEGRVTIAPLRIDALGGTFEVKGTLARGAADLRWVTDGLSLVELLRKPGETPKLAGRLGGSGGFEMTPDGISGKGNVQIRDGRLVMLPGLTQLANQLDAAMGTGKANHTLDASFELAPTGVRIIESKLITNTLAARGKGLIGYDGSLQLNVNAGPVARVQEMLGAVGDAWAAVTDRMVVYKVRGTLGEPTVEPAPLGVGTEITENTPEKEEPEKAAGVEEVP